MGIGKRTEYRVFQTIQASAVVSRVEHRPFDRFSNFFSLSDWTVESLAHQVCVAVVLALNPTGWLYLLVADTLLYQRGKLVHQAVLWQSAKPAPYNGDERPIAWDLIGLRGRERRATMTVESEEAGLTDLLIRWEELRERGESIPVEELCAKEPELADAVRHRIDGLKAMAPLIGPTVSRPDADDGGAAPVPPPPRQSATCVAEYREFRFHAEGGLGEVFMAHGEDLNRDVALKFIKAQRVHDPDCQRRFFQEAEITGRLEHPGIVPVYSLGHDGDGSPCYAMRFI